MKTSKQTKNKEKFLQGVIDLLFLLLWLEGSKAQWA